jgi:hypothetical protein
MRPSGCAATRRVRGDDAAHGRQVRFAARVREGEVLPGGADGRREVVEPYRAELALAEVEDLVDREPAAGRERRDGFARAERGARVDGVEGDRREEIGEARRSGVAAGGEPLVSSRPCRGSAWRTSRTKARRRSLLVGGEATIRAAPRGEHRGGEEADDEAEDGDADER